MYYYEWLLVGVKLIIGKAGTLEERRLRLGVRVSGCQVVRVSGCVCGWEVKGGKGPSGGELLK